MVDVFEQVEEELRSDRYRRLARTWLPVVGGVLLIALIAALSWWGWDSYQNSRADKASVAYDRGMEALQADNAAGAQAAFVEAAEVGNGAYKALALQQQAAIAVATNRIPDAIRLFDEAAKATRDPIIADAARLKAAYLVMDTGASLADLEARLTPLADEDRPLAPFAQEALAMAKLQYGKTADARVILLKLTQLLDVPDTVRQRAQVAMESIDSGGAAALPAIIRAQAALPPAPTQAQGPAQGQGQAAPMQAAPPASTPTASTPAPSTAQ